MDVLTIAVGILVGLAVTAGITLLWPPNSLRWLRPIGAAALGLLVAWLIITLA